MRIFKPASADNCEGVRPLLSSYIDNQNTTEEREVVERHLATCQACRNELAQLRVVVNGLHSLPEVVTPRSFAVRASDVRQSSGRSWLADVLVLRRAAATLAASLILLFGLGLVLPGTNGVLPASGPAYTRTAPAAGDTAATTAQQPDGAKATGQTDRLAESAPPGRGGAEPMPTPVAAPAAPAAAPAAAPEGTPEPAAAQALSATATAPAAPAAPQATPPREQAPVIAAAPAPEATTTAPPPPAPVPATAPAVAGETDAGAPAIAEDRRSALWMVQMVVGLLLVLLLVGGFLGSRRGTRP